MAKRNSSVVWSSDDGDLRKARPAKAGVIELQGDHRDLVVNLLQAEGYRVVLAGG